MASSRSNNNHALPAHAVSSAARGQPPAVVLQRTTPRNNPVIGQCANSLVHSFRSALM